jgi:hypothetical protein
MPHENLWGESFGEVGAVLKIFTDLGVSPERFAQVRKDKLFARWLAKQWSGGLPSFVYPARTVCNILGFVCDCDQKPPKPEEGEIVVWYGGWTLGDLVKTKKVFFEADALFTKWAGWSTSPGYYHVRIPACLREDGYRGSSLMDSHHGNNQIDFIKKQDPRMDPLPVEVGATALAVHYSVTGQDPLDGISCRCAYYGEPAGYSPTLKLAEYTDSKSRYVHVEFYKHSADGPAAGAARRHKKAES